MTEQAQLFERNRRRLHGLAYGLLGSLADADDVLQDLYVRWHGAGLRELHSPEAWLTTALTRLCIDRMRARDRERKSYLGSWLPEPYVVVDALSPDRELELADDLSMALLVLLERLTPEERTVFLLHDVFDWNHREIAVMLGRAEAAGRQLLHRARERIRAGRPRFSVSDDVCRNMVTRFLRCSAV